MKKRILCLILVFSMVLMLASCFKQKPVEKKYDYDMNEYLTLPDLTNVTIDIELDALQAAIDSYLVNSATEYTVSRGDDIYVDITVYDEMILTSNSGEEIRKKGNKIDELSIANYLVENLGSSPLPYKLESEIINAELKMKDIITRKFAYEDVEKFAYANMEITNESELAGKNYYFEVKIMNKKTEPGDVVVVSYEAYLVDENNAIILDDNGNETPFDKGSGSSFFLGSHLAIDDFENGLTGILLYEENSFYATFPDDYIEEKYQNKKALFEVKVTGLYVAPIYNNSFVKSISEYASTADFEAALKKEYLKEKMFSYAYDNVVIKEYPKAEYNMIKSDIEESAGSFKEYYGVTFDEYIKDKGYASRDEYIKSNMRTEMVYYAIAKQFNLTPTDEMLENEKQSLITLYKSLYMEQQGLDEKTALSTAETFVENLGKVYIYENVIYSLVENELYLKAKSNEIEKTYESISEVLAKGDIGQEK